jgi:5-methyltetrahydrofolate--homocysteine methyltransferase
MPVAAYPVSKLLSDNERSGFEAEIKAEYAKVRVQYEGSQRAKEYISLDRGTREEVRHRLEGRAPGGAKSTGVFTFRNFPLDQLVPYIDWTPFFMAWELAGTFPEASSAMPWWASRPRKLHADAMVMLDRIVKEQWLQATRRGGHLAGEHCRTTTISSFTPMHRGAKWSVASTHCDSNRKKAPGVPYIALADFVAPKRWRRTCSAVSP